MHHLLTSPSPARSAPAWQACRPWLAALAVCTAGVVVIARSVLAGGMAVRFDRVAALHAAPDGSALAFAAAWASRVHGTAGLAAMTAAVAVALVWRRRAPWGALLVVIAMLGGMAANSLLKAGIARPRPDVAVRWGEATGHAFPSGHVMLATVLYALVLLCLRGGRVLRLAGATGACAMVALVAIGRVASGAHHASDVLAAVPAGMAWLALVAIAAHLAVPRVPAHAMGPPGPR